MIIKGDINGDGKIDVIDQVLARAHILGIISLSGNEFVAGDINNDDLIDIMDMALLRINKLRLDTINEVIY